MTCEHEGPWGHVLVSFSASQTVAKAMHFVENKKHIYFISQPKCSGGVFMDSWSLWVGSVKLGDVFFPVSNT